MTEPTLSFGSRLALAWRVLTDSVFARQTTLSNAVSESATVASNEQTAATQPLQETTPDAALQLISLLQQNGRLLDFLYEDVSAYSDAEIGGAARLVHTGCRKVMDDYFQLEPISENDEGAQLTLPTGFDSASFRLTGNVVGEAPFSGTLVHRGWRARETNLPRIAHGHDASIIAPAELEL